MFVSDHRERLLRFRAVARTGSRATPVSDPFVSTNTHSAHMLVSDHRERLLRFRAIARTGSRATPLLGEDFGHDSAVDVCQAVISTGIAVGELSVINAE